jgi:hypothetical protein
MSHEKQFVYKSTLTSTYGLTPIMVAELGEPDKVCENPHWKSGPSASLYCVDRVETWVAANKERLQRAKESRVRRAAAAKAVWDAKRGERRRKAEEWVNTVPIEVAPLPDTLIEDARRRHPNLTEKGLRAHVRHRLTNYESLLGRVRRHEFEEVLYPALRERVDAAVGRALDEWREHSRSLPGGELLLSAHCAPAATHPLPGSP